MSAALENASVTAEPGFGDGSVQATAALVQTGALLRGADAVRGRIFRSVLLRLMTPVVGFVIVSEWETGTIAGIAALLVIIAVISSLIVLTVLRFARTTRFSIPA